MTDNRLTQACAVVAAYLERSMVPDPVGADSTTRLMPFRSVSRKAAMPSV